MRTTEDRARAAMRAIADTVDDAPPLRFGPAQEPGKSRRWRSWLVPVAAAALVAALALSQVLVKELLNGSAAPKSPSPSAAGPGGAPRYYVALKEVVSGKTPQIDRFQFGIVVGDSLTGTTLATFKPPAHTTFQNVTAAADDRTFVVFAVTSSNGGFDGRNATLTGSWYKLRLAPGTARPARLSLLPIKPWSWTGSEPIGSSPGQIYATALSGSGQELAVAGIPEVPAASKPQNWQEVKVFSVATGRLLHDWTGNDPTARLGNAQGGSMAGVPAGTPALTWIDGDQALAIATSRQVSGTVTGTVRKLNVTGPASGNLMTDSTVIWSGTLSWNDQASCYRVSGWPPQISADGDTITCATFEMPYASPGHINFGTAPLTAGTAPGVKPTIGYRATIPPEKQTGGITLGILWTSSSGDTLIVTWVPGGTLTPPDRAHFGVVSHGKFTPLRIPASLAASTVTDITF